MSPNPEDDGSVAVEREAAAGVASGGFAFRWQQPKGAFGAAPQAQLFGHAPSKALVNTHPPVRVW